eukprot:jgi/Chrzof1/2912/Cz12g03210.t1
MSLMIDHISVCSSWLQASAEELQAAKKQIRRLTKEAELRHQEYTANLHAAQQQIKALDKDAAEKHKKYAEELQSAKQEVNAAAEQLSNRTKEHLLELLAEVEVEYKECAQKLIIVTQELGDAKQQAMDSMEIRQNQAEALLAAQKQIMLLKEGPKEEAKADAIEARKAIFDAAAKTRDDQQAVIKVSTDTAFGSTQVNQQLHQPRLSSAVVYEAIWLITLTVMNASAESGILYLDGLDCGAVLLA